MKVKVEFQEPDRKKKIKRIIAREGMVLLVTIFLCFSYMLTYLFVKGQHGDNIVGILVGSSLMLIYPVRLLIYFIIWAIRTLREK
jgi:hypothetical protein